MKLLAATAFLCVLAANPAQAILNGQPIPAHVRPSAKKLILGEDGKGLCSGVLVGPRVLLTAGHCGKAAQSGSSVALKVDGVKATGLVIHPKYLNHDKTKASYDIAVVSFGQDLTHYARIAS